MLGAGALCLLCLIPPQVTEEIPFVGWTKPIKVCSHLPVSELPVLQVNSTEAENQTGKSSSASAQALPESLTWCSTLTPQPAVLFHMLFCAASCDEEDCKKNQICEYTSTGVSNCTCASGFYGDKCEGMPAGAHGRRLGRYRGRLGFFNEELFYPTVTWSRAREEAAVMMDSCNYQNWHGLAQFTTGTRRLMLWIIGFY